jgi:pimeloyl-ACP methyl ester carboxylesterase
LRLRRVALGLIATLVLFIGAGAMFQVYASARDTRDFPPPGRLVDVGGVRLHLKCSGEANGDPTVVLENGLTAISSLWFRVQSELEQEVHVCTYDRAGIGWSDLTSRPRDPASVARELHTLLVVAGVGGPYVLAGHSIGAIYAQAFQALYPNEVAGIAFIEGSPRDNFATAKGQRNLKQTLRIFSSFPTLARFGFMHVMPWCSGRDFPERAAAEIHAACSAVHGWQASRAELNEITAFAPLGDLSALPIAVVSAGDHLAADAEWTTKQHRLAGLSAKSSHEIIAGADHGSVLKDKDDAHRSSLAILGLVRAVRERSRPVE